MRQNGPCTRRCIVAADARDCQMKERLIKQFMRFVMVKDLKKLPAKQDDIKKHVLEVSKVTKFTGLQEKLFEVAKLRFKNIFGFELVRI